MSAAESSTKKTELPEQGEPQPDSRGVCAVGGAGPDKRIDEILDNVKEIRRALPISRGELPAVGIEELTDTVKDILSTVREGAMVDILETPVIISYPKTGKKTLTTGTTTLNLKGRQAILADGTVDDIYSPRSFRMCRSLLIYTDREIDVRVLNGGDMVLMSSFFTGSQQLLNLGEFDNVEIEATGNTQFYIAMSEDPEGAPSTPYTGPVTEINVVTKPTGETRETDSAATAVGSFTEIVSHTPADGVTFSLAKILVTWSGTDEQQIRMKLDTEVIGEYYATDYVMDWFPPGTDLVGDGTKKVVVEAEATAVIATLTGFIAGETA